MSRNATLMRDNPIKFDVPEEEWQAFQDWKLEHDKK